MVAPKKPRYSKSVPNVSVPGAIVDDILTKKDLLVSKEFCKHIILQYLIKHPKVIAELGKEHFLKTKTHEEMKKWVRQELRVLVGMFIVESDPLKLLDERTSTILASHRSTAERMDAYPTLYDKLFGEKKPAVILDICAGLNPCSYEYLGCKPTYYAVDVSPQLMDFVTKFFQKHKISGKAWSADVTKITEWPNADTVFIFKGLDVLERINYGYGEKLLEMLGSRRVIASFATATISGKREINVKKRFWIERWCNQHGRKFRIHDIPGERFYIIE